MSCSSVSIEIIASFRVRFRCTHCKKVFTEYPPFAVPYKRFAKGNILQFAQSYLQNENQSYRQTVQGSHTPLAYDGKQGEQGQQLSRSTVWKWLAWLGGLKKTLRRGASLLLEKNPQENSARDVRPIWPQKFCLQARHDLLHLAARLLATADRVEQLFGSELIFTR